MTGHLSETHYRYRNIGLLAVQRADVVDPLISMFMKIVYQIAGELDREYGSEGRRALFVFARQTCSSFCSNHNYERFADVLLRDLIGLKQILAQFTVSHEAVIDLENTCEAIVARGRNLKFEFVQKQLDELRQEGIKFTVITRGNRWATHDFNVDAEFIELGATAVDFSTSPLKIVDTVFTSMPTGKIRRSLATDVMLRGGASKIISVLYECEFDSEFPVSRFIADNQGDSTELVSFRRLATLRFDPLYRAKAEEVFKEPEESVAQVSSVGNIEVLFQSGKTVVLPLDDEIWVARLGPKGFNFSEFWPDLLQEDDQLVFVPDTYVETSNSILDLSEVWRVALQYLLLSAAPSEIRELMLRYTEAVPSTHSIKAWADAGSYGPKDKSVFKALMQALVVEKALPPEEFEKEWEAWWMTLEGGRRDQLSKGAEARSSLIKKIRNDLNEHAKINADHVCVETVLAVQNRVQGTMSELGKLANTDWRVMQ
jgi:hypothetical protein